MSISYSPDLLNRRKMQFRVFLKTSLFWREGITPAGNVTLCRWSAKQTIPLSVLARNQIKGLDSRSRTRPEVGKGTRVESLKKGPREVSWRRATERGSWQSTPDREETSRHEIGSSSSEGRPVKMSQHSSWFVEFSLEIHAGVSLQGMQCHNLTFLYLSWPKPYCSFVLCSFLPLPWLYFLWP